MGACSDLGLDETVLSKIQIPMHVCKGHELEVDDLNRGVRIVYRAMNGGARITQTDMWEYTVEKVREIRLSHVPAR